MSTTVKLKDVRLSFPDLFNAVEFEKGDGKFRYNATFLVVPGSDNDKAVRAAIAEAAENKFGKKAAATLKGFENNPNKFCYVSGDTKSYEGYAGLMALSAHRKQSDGPVGVFDSVAGADGKPARLTGSEGRPYAGCYVNATVDIYAQDGQNGGIRCGLAGVQFWRNGDAFSGTKAADSGDFDVAEGADAEDIA